MLTCAPPLEVDALSLIITCEGPKEHWSLMSTKIDIVLKMCAKSLARMLCCLVADGRQPSPRNSKFLFCLQKIRS